MEYDPARLKSVVAAMMEQFRAVSASEEQLVEAVYLLEDMCLNDSRRLLPEQPEFERYLVVSMAVENAIREWIRENPEECKLGALYDRAFGETE